MRASLLVPFGVVAALAALPTSASAGTVTAFDAGAMIVPMDATWQDEGILDAYGFVYALLREGIEVHWVVDSGKVYDGYDLVDVPTYRTTELASAATDRSFAGGPFVVAADDVVAAQVILDTWQAAGWDAVAYYTSATVDMEVSRTMFVAPSIAIFEDGNEDIAWEYLNAAGIPDFDGNPWDAASTYNLSEADLVGVSGTAGDGALFDDEGFPAYCHLNAMHWSESASADVVMEVRAFAADPLTSSLFECDAADTIENDPTYGAMISGGIAKIDIDRGHSVYSVSDPASELFQMVGDWEPEGGSLPDFSGTLVAEAISLSGVESGGDTAYVVASARLDGDPSQGKVSLLGGHSYDIDVPYSANDGVNGVRVFLNSYFTADCANSALAPVLGITGTPTAVDADVALTLDLANTGLGRARHTALTLDVPVGLTYVSDDAGGLYDAGASTVRWDLATLDRGETETAIVRFTAAASGTYTFSAEAAYYVEATGFSVSWAGDVDVRIDTDDDGVSDEDEIAGGTDPDVADSDGDGLADGDEADAGTDPLAGDTDGDGLSDGEEVGVHGTDPLDADSDDDALTDGDEVNVDGTDPLDADSDDDALADGDEADVHGTDPLDADSDDGGVDDGTEVLADGTDPLDGADDAVPPTDTGTGPGDTGGGDSGGGTDTDPGDSGGGTDTDPGDSGGGTDTDPGDSGGGTDTDPGDSGGDSSGPDDSGGPDTDDTDTDDTDPGDTDPGDTDPGEDSGDTDLGDTDPADEIDEEDKGGGSECGCGTPGAAPEGLALAVGGLLLALRRRRD